MEDEPKSIRNHPRTEGSSNALNQRNHVPVTIGNRQVDRVSLLQCRIAGLIACSSLRVRDQFAASGGVLLRKEALQRKSVEGRIGIEFCAILEGQLLRLDEIMDMLPASEAKLLQVIGLQNIEHLQGGHPLPVGWKLPDVIAAIIGRDGFNPV